MGRELVIDTGSTVGAADKLGFTRGGELAAGLKFLVRLPTAPASEGPTVAAELLEIRN